MNRSRRRAAAVFSLLLLLLAGAALIALSARYRAGLAEKETAQAQPFEGSALTGEDVWSSISYYNGSASLSFSRDETGVWRWDDDPDFPLQQDFLQEFIRCLDAAAPVQTFPGMDLADCGFTPATPFLRASAPSGRTLHINYGGAVPKTALSAALRREEGPFYYAIMNAEAGEPVVLDSALPELMARPIYDLLELPELPDLSPAHLKHVIVQGAGAEAGGVEEGAVVLTAIRTEDDPEQIDWRLNGAGVSSNPAVRGLLEDLSSLAFSRCVDYHPSEEAAAVCGLEPPAATLTIVRFDANGAEDETLVFSVGDPLLDSSGRYVRLSGDDAIYAISSAQLSPLMEIAAGMLGE